MFMFSYAYGKFHVLSMYVMKLEWLMTRDYYFTISRKRGPVEILARSSISPESHTKVDFKVTAS